MTPGEMDAYRQVFIAESTDYIQQITEGLLALEREPTDPAPVEVIFRGAHSLKGMSAAMGFLRTADLTHAMEGLMAGVRSGQTRADESVVSAMLAAVDFVRDLIGDESVAGGRLNPAAMIARLDGVASAGQSGSPNRPLDGIAAHGAAQTPGDRALADDEHALALDIVLEDACVLKGVRAYMVLKRLNQIGRVLTTEPSARDLEDERFERTFQVTVATSATAEEVRDAVLGVSEIASVVATPVADLGAIFETPDDGAPSEPAHAPRLPKLADTQTVRVAIPHLDTLVDLVGEIVILRSRFDRLLATREDVELAEAVSDLHRISAELQFEVMQTRMVPVGNIFNRFPRMVRDLSIELEKQVRFDLSGLDIELDRTVLDEIGDPLVHLLRNSIDHGIESASVRAAAGKPAAGTITLAVSRERDHVAIVVADDGGGIDPELVWDVACRRGLVKPEERAEHSDSDILAFTCIPGFSTSETTTQISGRGVGLDVVKDRVEALGGTMQIASVPGEGSRFTLLLPLTLAIVKTLLVESHGQPFALPISAVNEVFASSEVRVDTIDGVSVLVGHGDDVLPLIRLGSVLFGDPVSGPLPEHTHVVLVATANDVRALAVDRLLGRQEIVVKPLSPMFSQTRGFSGATILGDGRVMLILDPRTLFTSVEDLR